MISLNSKPVAVAALDQEASNAQALETLLSRFVPGSFSLLVLPFGIEGGEGLLAQWAQKLECYVVGAVKEEGRRVAVVVSPGGERLGVAAQTHALPGEAIVLGDRIEPIATPLGRLGISIGSDLYFPEVHWSLAQQRADVLIHLASGEEANDHFYSVHSPAVRAFDVNRPFILARCTSKLTKLVHNEEMGINGTPMAPSVIYDQSGATLASTGFRSGVVVAQLHFEQTCFPGDPASNSVLYGGNDVWKLYFNDSRHRFFGTLRKAYAPLPKPAYAKRKIKIAILSHQYAVQVGDARFQSLVQTACEHRPDIIVATEMESGCQPDKPEIAAALEAALAETRRIGSWLLIGGMRPPEADTGHRRSSTGYLWDRTGRLVHQSRIMLYGNGIGQTAFDTDFGRIGIRLCGDVYAPELDRLFAMQGVEIVFNPSMSWGASGLINTLLNQVRAMDNGHFVVSGHLAFSDPGQRSHVIDPTGAIVAASPYYTDDVLVAEIDLDGPRGIFVVDRDTPPKSYPDGIYLRSYRASATHRLMPPEEWLPLRRPELYEGLDSDLPEHPFTTRFNGMNRLG